MSLRRLLLWAWLALTVVWIGSVAYVCVRASPQVPLDISLNDPQTQAAYQRATAAHLLSCLSLGVLPPLVLLVLGWLGARLAAR